MLDRPAIVEIHAAHLYSGVVMEDDGDRPAIRLAVEHRLAPLVPLQRVGPILGDRDLARLMIARTRLFPYSLCAESIEIRAGAHSRDSDTIDLHRYLVSGTRAIDPVFPVPVGGRLRERRSTQGNSAKKNCNVFHGF